MTILIAAKDPNLSGIHLLSDSQTTAANNKYTSDTKWSEFKNFYIGIAGDTISKIIVREYLKEFLDEKTVNSKKDIIDIYKKIEETMETEFKYKHTENQSRNYMEFDIIVVTKQGNIYTCGEFLCVSEELQFATTGTGSPYAIGILNFIYQREMARYDTLSHIMEIIYTINNTCGGPTHYTYLPIQKDESTIV